MIRGCGDRYHGGWTTSRLELMCISHCNDGTGTVWSAEDLLLVDCTHWISCILFAAALLDRGDFSDSECNLIRGKSVVPSRCHGLD